MQGKTASFWGQIKTDPLGAIFQFQQSRLTWLVLFATALFLELVALYFQYVMLMDPCELCVYQRLAVLLIGGSAVVMMLSPTNMWLRFAGFLIWGSGTLYGLVMAVKMQSYYASSDLFLTCKALPTFPFSIPLHEWWPSMFLPSGFCGRDNWSFAGMNMAIWMTIIFSIYLIALTSCLLSLYRNRRRPS